MLIHLTGDLLLASRAGCAADALGVSIVTALSPSQAVSLQTAETTGLLVDLEASQLDLAALVTSLVNRERLVIIAYGPHVHVERLDAARQAGCDAVLSRGQLDRDMANVIRHLSQNSATVASSQPHSGDQT
jgi:hypothetical protein